MTEHGEQVADALRSSDLGRRVGRSFADVWGTEPPHGAPLATEPAPLPASSVEPAAGMRTAPAVVDGATSSGQGLSVSVSRPARSDPALSDSTRTGANGPVTIEIRRGSSASDSTRPPEQVVVTVSLDRATEQVVVTF